MSNATVRVVHPTQFDDGEVAALSDIKSWRVEMKASASATWSPLGAPRDPATTTAAVQNLTRGDWDFRVTWTDTDDVDSDPVVVTYTPGVKLVAGSVAVEPA